jgi:basic membrane protein A
MRFRRNLMGAAALAVSLGLLTVACGSDSGSSSDTTSGGGAATTGGEAATTAGGAATTAGGAATTAGGGGAGTCEAGTGEVPPLPELTADGAGKKVGLLFDVTGRGDKSFNDAAASALDAAKANFGVETEESAPTAQDGSDRPERMKAFIGDDLIVAVGFLWGDATKASAAENPNQKYAIVDSVVNTPEEGSTTPAPNVRSMVFAEHEGSFLVGAAAACASPSGKLGFIGGVENDLIKKFEAGFTAGAQAVNPDATVEVKYITQPPDFTGFNDPAKGKAIAKSMYDSGIDIVYAAAGGSGKGLFEAVKETGKKPGEVYAIGVDSDQYNQVAADLQPYILTSALKRVDVATYEAIADTLNGKLTGEVKTYDLKNNGVGYAISNEAINQYAGTLEKLKADIISGTITVPDKPGG